MNFREGSIIFKEKYLEEGLNITRKNGSLFTIVMIAILVLNSSASSSGIIAMPNYLYEPTYLCKNKTSQSFSVICDKKFVCNSNNILNRDYILDKEKFKTSFVTVYNIYCSNLKISTFVTSYYFGGILGILLAPEILKCLGNIELILGCSIICVICNLIMAITTNYYVGITVYTFLMITKNTLFIPAIIYQIEMVKPIERGFLMGLSSSIFSISGLLVNFMEITTGDYQGQIIANSFLFIVTIVLTKLLLVDSIRNTFIKGNYLKVFDDLEYIAKFNNNQKAFYEWKARILAESKEIIENTEMFINEEIDVKNKYQFVNYWNLWSFKSLISPLIFFNFVGFVSQLNFMFLLNEQKKMNNFFLSSNICYLVDILGNVVGVYLIQTDLKRKNSTLILCSILGIAFIISGFFIANFGNIKFLILLRFLNASLFSPTFTWGFELFPSMVRNHSICTIRVLSSLLNFGTPYLIISHSILLYFIAGFLVFGKIFLILILNIKETHGISKEFPEELEHSEALAKFTRTPKGHAD